MNKEIPKKILGRVAEVRELEGRRGSVRRQGELEEENKDERGRQARRRSLNFLGRKGSESRDADDQAGNGSGRCSAAALGRASEDTRPWQADSRGVQGARRRRGERTG